MVQLLNRWLTLVVLNTERYVSVTSITPAQPASYLPYAYLTRATMVAHAQNEAIRTTRFNVYAEKVLREHYATKISMIA